MGLMMIGVTGMMMTPAFPDYGCDDDSCDGCDGDMCQAWWWQLWWAWQWPSVSTCRWRELWRRAQVCGATRSWARARYWWTVRLLAPVPVNGWDMRSPSVAATPPRTPASCTGALTMSRIDFTSPTSTALYVPHHKSGDAEKCILLSFLHFSQMCLKQNKNSWKKVLFAWDPLSLSQFFILSLSVCLSLCVSKCVVFRKSWYAFAMFKECAYDMPTFWLGA